MPIPNLRLPLVEVDKAGNVTVTEVNVSEENAIILSMPGPSMPGELPVAMLSIAGVKGCTGVCEEISAFQKKLDEPSWTGRVTISTDAPIPNVYCLVGNSQAQVENVCGLRREKFAGVKIICDPTFEFAKATARELNPILTTKAKDIEPSLDAGVIFYQRFYMRTYGEEIREIKRSSNGTPEEIKVEAKDFIEDATSKMQRLSGYGRSGGVAAGR